MQEEVDTRALFADLEKRGIEYAGDEEWHIAREAERLKDARERAVLAAAKAEAMLQASREAEARAQRLLDACESGDTEAFDRAFWDEPAVTSSALGKLKSGIPTVCKGAAVPDWLVMPDEEDSSLSASDEDWVSEVLNGPRPERRWTYDGLRAHHYIRQRRKAMLDARSRVLPLDWDHSELSGAETMARNFPSFVKSLGNLEEDEANALNEEQELFHPGSRSGASVLATPWTSLPSWRKLPGVAKRSLELQELVSGARFASVAHEDGDLRSWFWKPVGDNVCSISIELPEDAAQRFLAGERGDVGAAIHRSFRRRLERLLGPVALAAVWVRPPARPQAVTVFLMIRREMATSGWATEELRRSRRFYESLQRHGVELPAKSPIEVIGPHLSDYLGISEEELRPKLPGALDEYSESPLPTDDPRVARVVDYTPESGLATDEELAEHAERSDQWWAKHTRRYGLPLWFDHRFVGLLQDSFLLSPEHVRERQKVSDALKHRQGLTTSTEKRRLRTRSSQLLDVELGVKTAISYFRASPACFAALASRSGEILGEYCDSRHKAGRAREMYEELRKETIL